MQPFHITLSVIMEHEHLHTYLLGFEIKADNNEAF